MSKYLSLLRYEARTIVREPVNLYMCLFPALVLLLSTVVFPMILQSLDPIRGAMLKAITLVMVVMILAFGSFFLAALATFLLLEQKDENTLHTIAVTPVGASGYLRFKMTYVYLMSVVGNIVILLGTKLIAGDKYTVLGIPLLDGVNLADIIAFSAVNALLTPAMGLLQSAFARNKVEGFALIKGTGILALAPALMTLEAFQGNLQYVLGIFPNFWAIKGLLVKLMPVHFGADLSYSANLLIGAAYNGILAIVAYRFFLKKAQY